MTVVAKANLKTLADTANEHHRAAALAARTTIEHAFAAGEALAQAKTEVAYGRWEVWVEENCDFSLYRTKVYIRLATNRQALTSEDCSELTVYGALEKVKKADAIKRLKGDVAQEVERAAETEEITHEQAVQLKREIRKGLKAVEDGAPVQRTTRAVRSRLRDARIDRGYTDEQRRLRDAEAAAIDAAKRGKAFVNALARLYHEGHAQYLDARHALVLSGTVAEITDRMKDLSNGQRTDGEIHVIA